MARLKSPNWEFAHLGIAQAGIVHMEIAQFENRSLENQVNPSQEIRGVTEFVKVDFPNKVDQFQAGNLAIYLPKNEVCFCANVCKVYCTQALPKGKA
uniref:Uncharacterized protein n=1 Tax=Romanomermis culicivorax TaxID=13658 RepID=A0A915K020_ROMCU